MIRKAEGKFINLPSLEALGLDFDVLHKAINQTYDLLDKIDATLINAGVFPLSQTVELANLSSMIGNVFGAAIAHHSQGRYKRNGPHKYPDLLSTDLGQRPNIEIKMALESNKPKGHLAKEGQYLTCRYVLCDAGGSFKSGKEYRGVKPYIWELRAGYLCSEHFNISNTDGDSGKTAVVNADGMSMLKVIYYDSARAPLSPKGRAFAAYSKLISDQN